VERVLARLEELYAIGGGEGANRPALSDAEQAAHELAAGWMRGAGLEVGVDGAGNLIGRRLGSEPGIPEIWTGSHLDTLPAGGRFDGALGVVAAIEALERLPTSARTVAAVAFRDEGGWRFGRGFFGSRSLCGLLAPADSRTRGRHRSAPGPTRCAPRPRSSSHFARRPPLRAARLPRSAHSPSSPARRTSSRRG
jgi:allantoate deiminase